jgi:hypothetical protein
VTSAHKIIFPHLFSIKTHVWGLHGSGKPLSSHQIIPNAQNINQCDEIGKVKEIIFNIQENGLRVRFLDLGT